MWSVSSSLIQPWLSIRMAFCAAGRTGDTSSASPSGRATR